jgi:hypothetical protein
MKPDLCRLYEVGRSKFKKKCIYQKVLFRILAGAQLKYSAAVLMLGLAF